MSIPSMQPRHNMPERQIDRLLWILSYLRTHADGCAWTKAQTHKSIVPNLLEESYEAADAIDQGKDNLIRDELGDVLLQIVFHAQIADERGAFDFEDVAQSICEKLIRRYPSIFGSEANTLKTPEQIAARWEEVKAEERKAKGINPETASILDDVSHALPALVRAEKLKARAAKEGWEWPDTNYQLAKIREEIEELREEIEAEKRDRDKIAAEFGDLLFMMVDFARYNGIDAEEALRITNNRFERRFRYMETGLKERKKTIRDSSRDDRISLWNEAKKKEKAGEL